MNHFIRHFFFRPGIVNSFVSTVGGVTRIFPQEDESMDKLTVGILLHVFFYSFFFFFFFLFFLFLFFFFLFISLFLLPLLPLLLLLILLPLFLLLLPLFFSPPSSSSLYHFSSPNCNLLMPLLLLFLFLLFFFIFSFLLSFSLGHLFDTSLSFN